MTFNRTVLKQVAKDGVTYRSLAKEMAEALLKSGTQSEMPREFVCFLSIDRYDTERADEQLRNSGIPIFEYRIIDDDHPSYNPNITLFQFTLRTP